MKKKEYTVLIEMDEDGYYVGEVIELPGCFTQARSLKDLMKRVKEAIEHYLEEVDVQICGITEGNCMNKL